MGDENPYAEHVDALNERDVADRLREPMVGAAVSAVWPKVDEVWERVPRIDTERWKRTFVWSAALLAMSVVVTTSATWTVAAQERERAERERQYDAIEQRLREMERQNAVMLDRLIDIRERDTVRYDEQLDAWVVIERAR